MVSYKVVDGQGVKENAMSKRVLIMKKMNFHGKCKTSSIIKIFASRSLISNNPGIKIKRFAKN